MRRNLFKWLRKRRSREPGQRCLAGMGLLRDMDEPEPRVKAGMSGGAEPV